MKNKLTFVTAAVASLVTSAVSGPVSAAFIPHTTSVSVAGGPATPGTDYKIYELKQATCETSPLPLPYPDNYSIEQNAVFHGQAVPCIEGIIPGPGSNMELGPEIGAFPIDATVLSGVLPSHNKIELSSLLETDWNSPIGNLTLAEKYIIDASFVGCGITTFDAGALSAVVDQFLAGNFAARLSDPNISFVNEDLHKKITIGLAGRYDISDLIPIIAVCPAPLPSPDLPQASEVVKFSEIKKHHSPPSTYLYSFFGMFSGVHDEDTAHPHSATYLVSPLNEPPMGEKTGEVVEEDPSIIVEWKMTWTNPNPTSVAVKVSDRIGSGQSFDGGLTCEGMFEIIGLVEPISVCEYNPGGHRVNFEGLIPPGGTVMISYQTTAHHLPAFNTASMCWDRNGTGTSPDVNQCRRKNDTPPVSIRGIAIDGVVGMAATELDDLGDEESED